MTVNKNVITHFLEGMKLYTDAEMGANIHASNEFITGKNFDSHTIHWVKLLTTSAQSN